MPADIRSFFAPRGGSSQDRTKTATKPSPAAKKAGAGRAKKRVIVDSDDEEEEAPRNKSTPKKAAAPPPKKVEEVVDTSSYFGSKNKITRTAPVKTSKPPVKKTVNIQPKAPKEEENFIDDDDDFADDIFAAEYKKHNDDDDEPRRKRKASTPSEKANDEAISDAADDDDFLLLDVQEEKHKKPTTTAGKKRKIVSDEEDDFEKPAKAVKTATAKKSAATPKKATTRTPKKKAPEEDTSEVQKILDSVPTVRPPTPPPKEEDKKFTFRDFKQKQATRSAPAAAGTKEIPTGAENCLAGLTFVFTGELATLSREDGQQLIKRYGGRVTTAPSRMTSFVVLGRDAGPKKLETIRSHKIKTIDEDGLFHLIRTLPANGGDSKAALAAEVKRAAEEKKVLEMAKQMAKEMEPPKPKGKGAEKTVAQVAPTELWTVKYAPTNMSQICGNKAPVERLQRWLRDWHKNAKVGFKKRGEDGSGVYRAVMIHGPPGIGKTTAAHLVAKMEGYDIVESNASDTRSKKLMEASLKGVLDNKSLMGYFGKGDQAVDCKKQKLVLIMDEVDGMSAGDRGGVGQLASICKKTSIPIICICNERKLPKMRPFDHVTYDLAFRRPEANAIRSRIMSIAFREGLKLPPNVIDQLVEGTGSDIRQIINMISTFAVNGKDMNFDQSKEMAKSWEKHVILKPWDIASKLLGPSMFAANANKSLNDKLELYFNDHEFSFLMIQENYLKTSPSRSSNYNGREKNLKNLELMEAAAASISDGDLVDALIHGQQQHWSLMPVHGVFSTVTPASYAYGGYGGQMFSFTTWLGNNSKHGKLSRFVKEIQSHMRLRASGDRNEIRQNYIPTMWMRLAKRLEDGKEVIDEVIDLMDEYYLTRDDYDAIIELGVGPMSEENLKIQSQVKAGFTREYNGRSHPMPFVKATIGAGVSVVGKVKKEVPDLEEAIEESEEEVLGEEAEEGGGEEEDMDLSKDKYVKLKKPGAKSKGKGKEVAGRKGAAAGSSKAGPSKGKGRGKGKAAAKDDSDEDEGEDIDREEVVKPARGKGSAARAGHSKVRGRGGRALGAK